MSTGTKSNKRGVGWSQPHGRLGTEDDLRRARLTAIVVIAVMLAIIGATIWLASLGVGPVENGFEHWYMMP